MTQILKAEINWMKGWANLPTLSVWVDKLPNFKQIPYRTKDFDGATAYWAQDGDWVNFFHHTHRDQNGYGGAVFTGFLENGKPFAVKGPWSSNSLDMNRHFPPCHEVVCYEEGHCGFAGFNLRAPKFIGLVIAAGGAVVAIDNYGGNKQADLDVRKFFEDKPLPYTLAIVLPGMTLEESQKAKNVGWRAGRKM